MDKVDQDNNCVIYMDKVDQDNNCVIYIDIYDHSAILNRISLIELSILIILSARDPRRSRALGGYHWPLTVCDRYGSGRPFLYGDPESAMLLARKMAIEMMSISEWALVRSTRGSEIVAKASYN
jgi:hypothetical protein